VVHGCTQRSWPDQQHRDGCLGEDRRRHTTEQQPEDATPAVGGEGQQIAAWSVEPEPATQSCVGNLTLKSPGDPRFQQSIVSGLDAKISASGTTQVEGSQAGRYYVAVTSNFPTWTVMLAPA
jgi:hypothetical protein